MSLAQVTKQKSYLNRPKALGITVRRLQFHPEKIKRHYFANSPVMSHMLTALSSTFPIGEQFFVHSVRNVRDKVTDPTLQAQIAAFIGQEAMHSKAHSEFNDAWRRDHYNLDRFQAWLARKNIHVRSLHPWQDKWRSLPKIGGNLFGLYLLGKMLIQLLPEYLSYYKADFHPEEQDYSQIVKYWKEKMATEYHMQSFQEEVVPKLYS